MQKPVIAADVARLIRCLVEERKFYPKLAAMDLAVER